MDNYPPGAANDPTAPYNEPLAEPHRVLVSITLSKEFTVDVLKTEDREVDESDVRLEKFLPDEILHAVAHQDYPKLRMALTNMKKDAADWVVDELTVMEV
jgi:hypothetical protein